MSEETKNLTSDSEVKVDLQVSAPTIVNGEIVRDALLEYYTIVHTYDGFCWYATGIMSNSKEEALKQFGTWSGIKEYRLVKINLPTLLRTESAH